MNLQELKSGLGEYAKDIKLNLGSVLTEEGAPDLSLSQIYGIALSAAYATQNQSLVLAVQEEAAGMLTTQEVAAAKAAASIMAMNNIYYRFCHMVSDEEYTKLPAKLRMNVIGNPGIEKVNFELYALAVSAINGCGMCMDAHVHEVTKAGITKQGVQSCIRISAVIHAAAQAVFIGNL